MEEVERLFSVKMRASRDGRHVSGAERIVRGPGIAPAFAALADRALHHAKGTPDFINLKAEAVGDVLRVPALPVSTVEVATAEDGWAKVEETLRAAGFSRAGEIRALFRETYSMRGAMLLDADTLERLEPDRARGVRASGMDADVPSPANVKNHFAEALVLASKVLSAPGIVGEVCMSDDPDYVTGYVATRQFGYRRITRMKERGDESGGRIFLYRGRREDVAATVRYLESRPVVVETPACAAPDRFAALDRDRAAIAAAGLERTMRTVDSRDGCRVETGGRTLVSFASNDYLNFASDAAIASAAAKEAARIGVGSGASRLVTGTLPPHRELERRFASFKGAEDAIAFATGYMANLGAVSALVGPGDAVFSNALNHASLIDGCRLSGAEIVVYPHLDLDGLDRALASRRTCRRRLVVSDGVFSMDGDMLDLPRFLEVCARHDAFSLVDEAHALGVVGATGRGLCEHFGCALPDLIVGTLSKALGSAGGVVAGSARIVGYLRQKSRPYIFSTAPDVAAMAAASAAISRLEADPGRVLRLRANVAAFVDALAEEGVCVRTESAIVPIHVGDERRAVEVSRRLEAMGFLVPAIRYPSVAHGAARLRAAVQHDHSAEDLRSAARAIGEALRS